MATAEECRKALESLLGRITAMDPVDRAANFPERTMSCRVPDLGLVFATRIGPRGMDPVEMDPVEEAARPELSEELPEPQQVEDVRLDLQLAGQPGTRE